MQGWAGKERGRMERGRMGNKGREGGSDDVREGARGVEGGRRVERGRVVEEGNER